jgi:hypothetical protein
MAVVGRPPASIGLAEGLPTHRADLVRRWRWRIGSAGRRYPFT